MSKVILYFLSKTKSSFPIFTFETLLFPLTWTNTSFSSTSTELGILIYKNRNDSIGNNYHPETKLSTPYTTQKIKKSVHLTENFFKFKGNAISINDNQH